MLQGNIVLPDSPSINNIDDNNLNNNQNPSDLNNNERDLSHNNTFSSQSIGGGSYSEGAGNNPNLAGTGSPASHSSDDDDERHRPYTFNGKVVLGIGIILAVSAASTIFASSISQSPQVHLSTTIPLSVGAQPASGQLQHQQQTAAEPTSSEGKTVRKFVLVAHDFGWNGTKGGPPIQVNKGDLVQITFINAGHMAHNFGMAKLSSTTSELLNKTQDLPLEQRVSSIPYDSMAAMPCPGCNKVFDKGHIESFVLPDQQVMTQFTADQVGHFKYFCMVRGHIWLGMIGDLIVTDQPLHSSSSGGAA